MSEDIKSEAAKELLAGLLQAMDEEPVDEPLMNARGELPAVSRPNINLPAQGKTSYADLKRLRARHYKIIALHLIGKSNTDIAKELGITNQTVGKTLVSPLAQNIINEAALHQIGEAASLNQQMEELSHLGMPRLEHIIVESADDRLALSAIKTVLEYTLSKAATRTENVNTTVTAKDLVEMRRRAAEITPANLIVEDNGS